MVIPMDLLDCKYVSDALKANRGAVFWDKEPYKSQVEQLSEAQKKRFLMAVNNFATYDPTALALLEANLELVKLDDRQAQTETGMVLHFLDEHAGKDEKKLESLMMDFMRQDKLLTGCDEFLRSKKYWGLRGVLHSMYLTRLGNTNEAERLHNCFKRSYLTPFYQQESLEDFCSYAEHYFKQYGKQEGVGMMQNVFNQQYLEGGSLRNMAFLKGALEHLSGRGLWTVEDDKTLIDHIVKKEDRCFTFSFSGMVALCSPRQEPIIEKLEYLLHLDLPQRGKTLFYLASQLDINDRTKEREILPLKRFVCLLEENDQTLLIQQCLEQKEKHLLNNMLPHLSQQVTRFAMLLYCQEMLSDTPILKAEAERMMLECQLDLDKNKSTSHKEHSIPKNKM